MPHRLTKIDDARVFFGIVGSLFGSGYTVWLTLVAPHRNRLRQAKKFIEEISQTVNALTEDDKIAIDKYIAQVTAKDAKNTGCLLDTQHMFEELEKAQKQHTAVSEELKAHPSIQFPWSDLASSILALLDQCRDLHRSVQQSTTQGLQHRVQVSTPSSIVSSPIQQSPATSTTSSFIQQPRTSSATNSSFIPHPQASSATISSFIQHSQTSSATISSFIQQPPNAYFGHPHTGGPYSHSGYSTPFSAYSGGGHPAGGVASADRANCLRASEVSEAEPQIPQTDRYGVWVQ